MAYAPVTNAKYEIVPMTPLPPNTIWAEKIGFDPIALFTGVSIKDSFHLKVWARTNEPLPSIPLPTDPGNSSRNLPHCAYIDWGVTRVKILPTSVLLLWLFYQGVPLPKSTKRVHIEDQVCRAKGQHSVAISSSLSLAQGREDKGTRV